jgi:hypothetical protein
MYFTLILAALLMGSAALLLTQFLRGSLGGDVEHREGSTAQTDDARHDLPTAA